MTISLENGAGLSDANAFVTVAAADAYFEARGNADWTGEDGVKEAAIIRATAFLSNAYTWKGTRRNGRDQALAWPRYDACDDEGWPVPFDAVPVEIVNATCELALQELTDPGSMTPAVIEAERAKSLKAGSVAIEYASVSTLPEASRPVLLGVNDMISGLLASGGSSRLVGRAGRA